MMKRNYWYGMQRKPVKNMVQYFEDLAKPESKWHSEESATTTDNNVKQHHQSESTSTANEAPITDEHLLDPAPKIRMDENKPKLWNAGLEIEANSDKETTKDFLVAPKFLTPLSPERSNRESGYESPPSNRSSAIEQSEQCDNQIDNEESKVSEKLSSEYNNASSQYEAELNNLMDKLLETDKMESIENFLNDLKTHQRSNARTILENRICSHLTKEGYSKEFSVTLTSYGDPPSYVFIVKFHDHAFSQKLKRQWITHLHKSDINMESMEILAQKTVHTTFDECRGVEEFIKTEFQSTNAQILFQRHTNLNSISLCKGKSSNYGTSKWSLNDEICVVLHCLHKGFIPFGESLFPTKIGNYRTDVREGYCDLSTRAKVQVGRSVYTESNQMKSSVGNFVQTEDGSTAFITCAHAVLSFSEMERRSSFETYLNCGFYDSETQQEIGKVSKLSFEYNIDDSTDAALVVLNTNTDVLPGFPTIQMDQLQNSEFLNRPFDISSQTLEITSHNRKWKVVKYGAETQFTVGTLHLGVIICDFSENMASLNIPCSEERHFVMYNQFLINPIGKEPFLQQGDSGSFVFMADEQDHTLKCIGMLIGQTSCGQGIMTPIGRILKKFNLTELKAFGEPVKLQTTYSNSTIEMLSSMQIALTTIIGKMDNLGSRIDALESDVRDVKSDVYQLKMEQMDTT